MTKEEETVKRMQELAIAKINAWGSNVIFKDITPAGYDFTNGAPTPEVVVEYPIKAVVSAYKSEEIEGLINVGDIKLMIEFSEDYIPSASNDKIFMDNTLYNIEAVEPEKHADLVVYYDLRIRR